MRILIVRNAYSYDFGGAERLAVSLAEELLRQKQTVTVISRQRKLLSFAAQRNIHAIRGWWWSQQNWSGVRVVGFPLYFAWQVVLVFWYTSTILRINPDVVHLMSRDDFIAGTISGRILRKRVVWTDCSDLKHIYAQHEKWYKNPTGKLVYLCGFFAHTITLVSKNEKSLIERCLGHGLQPQYKVVYLTCVDKPTAHDLTNRDQHSVIFCSTSRLVEQKGIGELIDAFGVVHAKLPDTELWIVGDGPDEKKFHEQAGGQESIRFWGHQDAPLDVLATADIYVHPTYHEGFSLSLAEAAMLGKPLIATQVGGNPELVNENNGLLVKVTDSKSLATAMEQLARQPDAWIKLGKNARQDFLRFFELGTSVREQILPMYGGTDANSR